MPNMSYCRFTNTLNDLQDCFEHLDDDLNAEEGGMVKEEIQNRERLIELCAEILESQGWEVEQPD